jgi:hypothetical protein
MSTSLSGRSSVATTNPSRQQLDELDALLQRMLDLPVQQAGDGLAAEPQPDAGARSGDRAPTRDRAPAEEREAFAAHGADSLPASFYTVTEVVSAPLSMTSFPTRTEAGGVKPAAPSDKDVAAGGEEHRELDVAFASGSPLAPTRGAREEAGEAEAWVPFRSSWQPSPQTWQPLAESWQQGRAARATREEAEPKPGTEIEQARAVELASPQSNAQPPAAPAAKSNEALSRVTTPPSAGEEPEQLGWKYWPLILVNGLFDVLTFPLGPLGGALRSRWGRAFLGAVGVLCLAAAGAWAVLDYLGLDLLALLG